jgi:hypothetical protein
MSIYKKYIPRSFDWIGIGQMKCGSTVLWSYLMEHPDIFSGPGWSGLVNEKEPNFFNTVEEQINNGYFGQAKYSTWFKEINKAPANQKIGEFTVHYMDDLGTLERIKEHSPNAKIFAILRNPTDRAYSQFNWLYNTRGGTVWDADLTEILSGKEGTDLRFVYKSLYANQIENVYKVFPRSQVHFIKYEDFKADNKKELHKLFDHLEVDKDKYAYHWREDLLRPYIEPISKQNRTKILHFYLDDICRVEELLDWDCSDWKV